MCTLRLLDNPQDHLAWRTLLEIRHQGVGGETIKHIYEIAHSRGIRFTNALDLIVQGQEQIPRSKVFQAELQSIKARITGLEPKRQGVELAEFITIITHEIIADTGEHAAVRDCLDKVAVATDAKDVEDLLVGLQISLGRYEQDSGDVGNSSQTPGN